MQHIASFGLIDSVFYLQSIPRKSPNFWENGWQTTSKPRWYMMWLEHVSKWQAASWSMNESLLLSTWFFSKSKANISWAVVIPSTKMTIEIPNSHPNLRLSRNVPITDLSSQLLWQRRELTCCIFFHSSVLFLCKQRTVDFQLIYMDSKI